jgi:chemosensory pili system protein ChpA (sensor histidine kinase/response regulator)
MVPSDEHVKMVGPLRIGIPLFNIYLNEADELSRRLMTEVAEWAMELHRPIDEAAISLAHSLAGSSATVGFADLSHLARGLEHALARSQVIGHGTDEEARLFVDATEEVRRLLHQFAAGFLREPPAELLERLAEHEVSSAMRLEAVTAASELAAAQDEAAPAEAAIAFEPMLTLDVGPVVDTGAANEPLALEEEFEAPYAIDPVVLLTAEANLPAPSSEAASRAEEPEVVLLDAPQAHGEPVPAVAADTAATEPVAGAAPDAVANEPRCRSSARSRRSRRWAFPS